MGTLHSSVQRAVDSREDVMDAFGVAVFKFVLVISEHLVVLYQKITSLLMTTSVFVSISMLA